MAVSAIQQNMDSMQESKRAEKQAQTKQMQDKQAETKQQEDKSNVNDPREQEKAQNYERIKGVREVDVTT